MTPGGASEDALRSLFQEIILDHYRRPRNRGELADADATVHMNNPTCGDEVTVGLQKVGDTVTELRFGGHGCSISQASASMMTVLARGRDTVEIHRLHDLFKSMLHGGEGPPDPALGDARALAGVARFPTRVRCALLPWNALENALAQAAGEDG